MDQGTSSPQQPRQQQNRRQRGKRLRIACSRCHSRKIKCDAATPACTACTRAGAECVYEGHWPGFRDRRSRSRGSNASELQQRVQELEAQLRQERRAPAESPHHASPAPPTNGDQAASGPFGLATSSQPSHHPADTAPLRPGRDEGGPSLQRDGGPSEHPQPRDLSHQVGLVSLSAGADPRYVGPSSGYFFTQLLSSAGKRREGTLSRAEDQTSSSWQQYERDVAMRAFQATPCSLPTDKQSAQDLSEAYFRTIHLQYPFLHQPSHQRLIDHVYESPSPSPTARFQVTMVLSISAIVLSRRSRVDLPAAGWCAAAMDHFAKVQVEGSIHSLQCLLLMAVYAMHSPSSRFSAWNINYQCIAMVLDLGLQRDPPNTAPLSRFQREMRTRIFMVVYSLDRRLATMMGRPIGLRDEACDLRLPANIDDDALENDQTVSDSDHGPKHIDYAIHFFRHSIMNSEIKYILHSVRRDTPFYALPAVPDIVQWQDLMKGRLDEWLSAIPHSSGQDLDYGATLCNIQYHTLKMHLFLPTPGIPQPRTECLHGCYESSISAIRLFDELYTKDMLIYNWSTCHAVILHAFCLLYCATAVPQIADEVCQDSVKECLRAASNILSASGEYWAGAKRTRDLLNELANKALQQGGSRPSMVASGPRTDGMDSGIGESTTSTSIPAMSEFPGIAVGHDLPLDQQWQQGYQFDPLASLFGGYDQMDFTSDALDIGNIFADAVDCTGGSNYLQGMDFTI